jgi:hypothetical protein
MPVFCGGCKRTVPGEFVIDRDQPNEEIKKVWPKTHRESPYLCLQCINHFICYPFFELALDKLPDQPVLPDGSRLHMSNRAREGLEAITIEEHQCCYAEKLGRLEEWLANQERQHEQSL